MGRLPPARAFPRERLGAMRGSAGETEGPQSEEGTDAGDGAAPGPDPEFPRTAAKIWRMLRRLRQRGFKAFIN